MEKAEMNKIIDRKTFRIRTPLLAKNKKKLFCAAVIIVFALFLINILLNSKKNQKSPYLPRTILLYFWKI